MKTQIVLTGILRDKDLFLIVKRNGNDNLYPGAWEFPGGHLEDGETIKEGLKRELLEEIGFTDEFNPIITHYYDEIKSENSELIYNLEHSIHHQALIKVAVLKNSAIQLSENFGVAKSTIEYRNQCVQ